MVGFIHPRCCRIGPSIWTTKLRKMRAALVLVRRSDHAIRCCKGTHSQLGLTRKGKTPLNKKWDIPTYLDLPKGAKWF